MFPKIYILYILFTYYVYQNFSTMLDKDPQKKKKEEMKKLENVK